MKFYESIRTQRNLRGDIANPLRTARQSFPEPRRAVLVRNDARSEHVGGRKAISP